MIVVDATVLVKVLTREPGGEAALARIVDETDRLAPDWVRIEVASALARKVRNDGLSEAAAVAGLAAVPAFVTATTPALDLLDDALALSLKVGHTIYDCLYLALAIRHGCRVVTHDGQFAQRAGRAGWRGTVELLA